MKIVLIIVSMFFCVSGFAQEEIKFPGRKAKVTIPFKLINNLIIIPLNINGTDLNFLLDTGVEETILFSLEDEKEMSFYKVEKVKLRGLGSEDSTEGLRSFNNTIVAGKLKLENQEILIVIDKEMDFSSSLGIPINGILGSHFFKKNLIKINYFKKKIYVYNSEQINKSNIVKDYSSFDITIENSKPYIQSVVSIDNETIDAKLLLDTGNSDAIWLFTNCSDKIKIPEKNLDDFLGRGFSGEVYGKKARIRNFSLKEFTFQQPIVSFPDTGSLRNVKMAKDRLGSVGGELFKRFIIIFDYENRKMYAKKNSNFNLPFSYNKSGIEFHHAGLRMVQEQVASNRERAGGIKIDIGETDYNLNYRFELKPSYEIASIRKNSPADLVGLKKGDVLISINKLQSYYHTLQEINGILKSEDGRILDIEIERDQKLMRFKLQLKNLL